MCVSRHCVPSRVFVVDSPRVGPRSHWVFNLWSAFHCGVRAWTQTGYFEPVTAAGIGFSLAFSFSILLTAAA